MEFKGIGRESSAQRKWTKAYLEPFQTSMLEFFLPKQRSAKHRFFFKKKLYQRFLNGSKYAFVKAIQMFKAVIENSM